MQGSSSNSSSFQKRRRDVLAGKTATTNDRMDEQKRNKGERESGLIRGDSDRGDLVTGIGSYRSCATHLRIILRADASDHRGGFRVRRGKGKPVTAMNDIIEFHGALLRGAGDAILCNRAPTPRDPFSAWGFDFRDRGGIIVPESLLIDRFPFSCYNKTRYKYFRLDGNKKEERDLNPKIIKKKMSYSG